MVQALACGQGAAGGESTVALNGGTGTANIRTGPLFNPKRATAFPVATAAWAAVLALTVVSRSYPRPSHPCEMLNRLEGNHSSPKGIEICVLETLLTQTGHVGLHLPHFGA